MRFTTANKMKGISFAIIALILSGCTSVTRMSPTPAELKKYNVLNGNEVSVEKHSGEKTLLEFTTISEETISGKTEDGTQVEISNSNIKRIEVERVSVVKTVAVGYVLLSTVPLLIYAISLELQ